jgi:phage shock protein C
VAGGLATYLNTEPVLLRIAFLILSLANGLGLILYLLLWLLVPAEGTQSADARSQVRENASDIRVTTGRVAQQVVSQVRTIFQK